MMLKETVTHLNMTAYINDVIEWKSHHNCCFHSDSVDLTVMCVSHLFCRPVLSAY